MFFLQSPLKTEMLNPTSQREREPQGNYLVGANLFELSFVQYQGV